MKFIESFQVSCPTAMAFAYAADFSNLPDWDPSIRAVEKLTSGPVVLGTRFKVGLWFLGLPSELLYEVVEWESGRRAVLRASNLFVTATDTVVVDPREDGAKVVWEAQIDFMFPVSLADGLIAAAFRSNVVAAVRGLRLAIQGLPDLSANPKAAAKPFALDP